MCIRDSSAVDKPARTQPATAASDKPRSAAKKDKTPVPLAQAIAREIIPLRSSQAVFAGSKPSDKGAQPSGPRSYVTVLTSGSDPMELQGVLALQRSLRRTRAQYPLLCVCVDVSEEARGVLAANGVTVRAVARLAKLTVSEAGPRSEAALARLYAIGPVSYTHLTLPTIYSV